MPSDSPAADSTPEKTPSGARGLGGLLATRSRKIGAAVGAAVLAGIGGGIATWLLTAAQQTTKHVFDGSAAPLVVHVAAPGTFVPDHPYAPYYVIPRSRFPAGPNGISKQELAASGRTDTGVARGWLEAHGGIAGSPQIVRLELRGTADEPVTVTAIRPLIVKRSAPVRGWYVAAPGCGAVPVRIARINLDAANSAAEMWDDSTGKKILALSVTRTETEQIELHADTSAAVAWRAKVFYNGPKGDGSLIVDDAGKPFQVTTETASNGYRPQPSAKALFTREHGWDESGIAAC
jgi:hypothetical protein